MIFGQSTLLPRNNSNPDKLLQLNLDYFPGAAAIAAGTDFTCAVLSTGAFQCWGSIDKGHEDTHNEVDWPRKAQKSVGAGSVFCERANA